LHNAVAQVRLGLHTFSKAKIIKTAVGGGGSAACEAGWQWQW
jgi:hypothetical protein